jgi:putative NADH-flavin reductase
MNILIFGASGNTGQELVRQALAAGHNVTAFVRTPDKLVITHEKLKLIRGNVKDYSTVENAIKNQEAVLSTLGVSKQLKSDPIVIEGIKNILKAMEQMDVRRFIYLSFLAVGNGRNDSGFMIKNIISRIVHNEIADHEEKERLINSSPLEFTIVRPPKLSNGQKKSLYRSGETIKAKSILPTMSRADVADFMLKQLTDKTFLRKAARIMY